MGVVTRRDLRTEREDQCWGSEAPLSRLSARLPYRPSACAVAAV